MIGWLACCGLCGCDPREIGYVEIKLLPGATVPSLLFLGRDEFKIKKDRLAVLRSAVGIMTISSEREGQARNVFCKLEVKKNRIISVTIWAVGIEMRCKIQESTSPNSEVGGATVNTTPSTALGDRSAASAPTAKVKPNTDEHGSRETFWNSKVKIKQHYTTCEVSEPDSGQCGHWYREGENGTWKVCNRLEGDCPTWLKDRLYRGIRKNHGNQVVYFFDNEYKTCNWSRLDCPEWVFKVFNDQN